MNKLRVYKIVFESNTKGGKLFDVFLLWAIGLSVLVAMFDSIPHLSPFFKSTLNVAEWFFTFLFTIEYAVRIWISLKPSKYIFSFWGIIDLVAVFPTYLSLLFYGYHYILVVRILRMLRIFRVLRMVRFSNEGNTLLRALKASSYRISIFLFSVICIVVILGTMMYVVEGPQNGFTSVFQSIYWAIITITTVGYGDIVPQTVLGKFISSFTMIIGYAIIAVPTGIVTVEMSRATGGSAKCPVCGFKNSDRANYCNNCGVDLKENG